MTENADLVSEAALPLDRDKLEALQYRGNYIFNQIFFLSPNQAAANLHVAFCRPGGRGGCLRGAFLTLPHGVLLCSGCGWRRCPGRAGPGFVCGIRGAPLLENWETKRDKCDYRSFCIEALLEVVRKCRLMSPCFPRSGAALQGGASAGGEGEGVYPAKRERRRMSLIVFSRLSPEHLITFFFFFKDWTFHSLFL